MLSQVDFPSAQEPNHEGDDETLNPSSKSGDAMSAQPEERPEAHDLGPSFRKRYSRSELEKLRFVDVEQQRMKWKGVYENLGLFVAQEFDRLQAVGNQKTKRKKKQARAIKSEVSYESTPACFDVQNLSVLASAKTCDGQDNDTPIEEVCVEYKIISDKDDSSDDEYDSIRKPAFWVDGEPDFESGPPLDGLEYLRRVRWEAAQIPKVKVATLNPSKLRSEQTPYMPIIPDIAKCPLHLLPSKEWEDTFLADFSELRQAFSWIESSSDQSALAQRTQTPTMSTILDMDTVSRAVTLQNRISALEVSSVLSRDNCMWLFALCASVDTPLHADTSASLRSLLRKCSTLLAGNSDSDDEVAMLSILVVIAGKYFGQSEN